MGKSLGVYEPLSVTYYLPEAKLLLDLVTPEGCKAKLTWVTSQDEDSLPAKETYQNQPSSVMPGSQDRKSQVRLCNH